MRLFLFLSLLPVFFLHFPLPAAAALNELEMEGRCDDFHLGAWSASPERKKLSYTSFFPNRLKAKGFSLETLVLASIRRAEWAERTAKEMAATQSR